MLPAATPTPKYQLKPYEQMTYPGQRTRIDVKTVLGECIADPELKLYQYLDIDEFNRLRFLGVYDEHSSFSSTDLLVKAVQWSARRGIRVECVQTDNGSESTNRFTSEAAKRFYKTRHFYSLADFAKPADRTFKSVLTISPRAPASGFLPKSFPPPTLSSMLGKPAILFGYKQKSNIARSIFA